ncbi:N-acetylglucosamine-6-phosphate deacetylase [Shewanella maritima]|uniref:N-acetylglucosamine-6-phosphate deacetylase n=1 Tax=Shewanella maritima TaxID=2520507 RepID=UPI003736EE86
MEQGFFADTVFDGEQYHTNVAISVADGEITQFIPNVQQSDYPKALHLKGLLAPGLIDVQVNGGGGALFNAQPNFNSIHTIGQAHAQFGTTAFLPTVITDEIEVMQQAADAVAHALANNQAGVLGIHFEGPHLSVAKKGVHPAQFVREISPEELAIYARDDLGIKLVTLAPENVAPKVIKALVELGVIVCLGHSNADYQTVQQAIDAGATGFTHLYNAMSPLTSREPGVVGAALVNDDCWCGLIVDGHHVHPVAAKVALKSKPQGKMMLVTDAMPPVGMSEDASFELFGTQVIRQGDRLNAPSGELAGCVLDMIGAVNNSVDMLGVSEAEALRMASLYPAQFMNLTNYGRLKVGLQASWVVLDNQRQVCQTWIEGQVVFNQQLVD